MLQEDHHPTEVSSREIAARNYRGEWRLIIATLVFGDQSTKE